MPIKTSTIEWTPCLQTNILIIMSDEHVPIFSGPYGYSLAKTSNMEDQFVQFSTCNPNSIIL